MKVYSDTRQDFAIERISQALKKYAPKNIKFVDVESEADLIIMYAHSQRRKFWWKSKRISEEGRKYAIFQLCLRSTPNPAVKDWLSIWEGAEVVWSYYPLTSYCWADGERKANFNFYHSPLGVDSDLFKDYKIDRPYTIFKGKNRNESLFEIDQAGLNAGAKVVSTEGVNDMELVKTYNQCKYVSGLRKIEGFELPVIEGLLCGARPICYDRKHYRNFFGDMAEYIPEIDTKQIIKDLTHILKKEPRPVTDEEKEKVRERFNWKTIVKGFWDKL